MRQNSIESSNLNAKVVSSNDSNYQNGKSDMLTTLTKKKTMQDETKCDNKGDVDNQKTLPTIDFITPSKSQAEALSTPKKLAAFNEVNAVEQELLDYGKNDGEGEGEGFTFRNNDSSRVELIQRNNKNDNEEILKNNDVVREFMQIDTQKYQRTDQEHELQDYDEHRDSQQITQIKK